MTERIARTVIGLAVAVAAAGCGDQPQPSGAADWSVERSTEGGVTTVRNLAGSRWDTDLVAIEDVTIGVLEGAEEYMLAQPMGAWLTDTELYVVDRQDHRVRVYDHEGTYLRGFGREGQGPGELENPAGIAIVGDRVYIGSGMGAGRIAVFSTDGEPVADLNLGFNPVMELFAVDDTVYTRRFLQITDPRQLFDRSQAFQALGTDGFADDPIDIPDLGDATTIPITMMGREFPVPVPMAPRDETWSIAPQGKLIVGFADQYRFEIREIDGSPSVVVERYWEPVPITPGEKEQIRQVFLRGLRRQAPELEWDGDEIPATRPAYEALDAHRDGRIWLWRFGPATRREDCDEPTESNVDASSVRPCWTARPLTDVFNIEGEYLGNVVTETGAAFIPSHVYGDRAVTMGQSEDGAPQVKIYRLAFPDEESGP